MMGKIRIRGGVGSLFDYTSRLGSLIAIGGTELPRLPLPEITRRFEVVFERNRRVSDDKKVVHIAMRLAPQDPVIGLAGWLLVAQRVVARLGLDHGPWMAYLHTDVGEQAHMHVIASKITDTGHRVEMGGDRLRLREECRSLEIELGLQRISNQRGVPIKPPLSTPEPPIPTLPPVGSMPEPGVIELIRLAMSQALRPGISLPELRIRLAELPVPIHLVPKFTRAGDRIAGLGFRIRGTYVKASVVDRTYSLEGLKNHHGVVYDPILHLPALCPPAPKLTYLLPSVGRHVRSERSELPFPLPALPIPGPRIPLPHLGYLQLPPTPEVPHVSNFRSRLTEAVHSVVHTLRDFFHTRDPRLPEIPNPKIVGTHSKSPKS